MHSCPNSKQQNLHQVQLLPQLCFTSHPLNNYTQSPHLQAQLDCQPQQLPNNLASTQHQPQPAQPTIDLQLSYHYQITKTPTPMQLSLPTSTTTNPTDSQQQLTLRQFETRYSEAQQPASSNLQALKNIPRKITKNTHVKIECKTQFPLVRAVAVGEFGWTLMSKQSHKELVDLIWTDTYVTEELVNRLRPYQKVNHFPYSTQMGRKDYLFANLNKMRLKYKEDYNYFARTWIFPEDIQRFRQETDSSGSSQGDKTFYIAKPVASCQGKGIFLAKRQEILNQSSQSKLLVQEYIHNTLLLDGLKFDTRIYVLVKSLQPLSIYVYKQGLTRLATAQYEPPSEANYRNGRMHLTNYAVNKSHPQFVHNRDFRKDNVGHKRSLGSLFADMQKMGADVQHVKHDLNAIIVKTILAVYQKMTYLEKIQHRIPAIRESIKNISIVDANDDGLFARQPKTTRPIQNPIIDYSLTKSQASQKCFELLGFDIMFTDKFEPKLIEINHQPSLTASSPLDYIIKKCLVVDVFNLVNINSKQKESYLSSQRQADPQNNLRGFQLKGVRKDITTNGWSVPVGNKTVQLGGFSCIYPVENAQLMTLYHRLMPLLLIHEQPQTRTKRRESSFSFHKSSLNTPTHTFRSNKTTQNKKRQQYACNYINMLGSQKISAKENTEQKYGGEGESSEQISEHSVKDDGKQPEMKTDRKTTQGIRQTLGIGKITPRIKIAKLTQYDMPKKNLNFTIKHIRSKTKSVSKQTQSPSHLNEFISNQIHPQTSNKNSHKPQTPHPTSRTTFTKMSKRLDTRIQLTTKGPQKNMTKEVVNTEPRHSSLDTRIGIRLIKQKQDSISKIEIMTRGIGTPGDNTRKPSLSLQKYSYPIYEKNSICSTPNTPSVQTYQSVTDKPSSRSMQRNAEYFDRVYEKELIQRLNKMKTMKEKLEKLKRNSNRSDREFIASKEQFRSCKANDSHKSIAASVLEPENPNSGNTNDHQKSKSHSITTLEPQSTLQILAEKYLPFQTIKLMQFQQPQIKKANHNHHNQSEKHQGRDKVNNSMEMFKDEAFFNSHKKQAVHV